MKTRSLILLGLATVSGIAQADLTFTPLGDLPGGSVNSCAFALSSGGVIVGYADLNGVQTACRFLLSGNTVALPDLPGGFLTSRAYGVDQSGTVIVGRASSANGTEGCIWNYPGLTLGVGDLPGGDFDSILSSISDDGLVACGTGTHASGRYAFRYVNSQKLSLGDLSGGPNYSNGLDISGDGQVIVGVGSRADLYDRAFKTGPNDTLIELPLLPGAISSSATATNGNGVFVVGSCHMPLGPRAVRWNGNGIDDLGDLPGGPNASHATAIDPSGRFVGGNSESGLGTEAFLWDKVNGIRRLASVLNQNGIFIPGWRLTFVGDIREFSSDQLEIVGKGVNPNGDEEAFYARIMKPEVQILWGVATLPNLASTQARPLEIEVRQSGDVKYSTVVPLEDLGYGEDGLFGVYPDLPAGTYEVSFRYGHYLRRTLHANLASGQVVLYPDLVNGDVTRDNVVDSDDFDQLVRQFGTDKESSGENWVGTADLNEDDYVDSDDFDILVLNFGQYGDQ